MYLTAHYGVIPMDKVVYQPFKDSTVGIVGEIQSIIRHLHPSAHGVVLDDIHAIFQKQYKIGTMLHGADGIIFIKSRPTGTEYAGLKHGAVTSEVTKPNDSRYLSFHS